MTLAFHQDASIPIARKFAYCDTRVHLQMFAGVVPKGHLDRVNVVLYREGLQPTSLVQLLLVRDGLDSRWSDGSTFFFCV